MKFKDHEKVAKGLSNGWKTTSVLNLAAIPDFQIFEAFC